MNSGRERTFPTPTRGSMLIKSSRFITDSKKKRSQTVRCEDPKHRQRPGWRSETRVSHGEQRAGQGSIGFGYSA